MLSEHSQVSPRTVWTVGLHGGAVALALAGAYSARGVLGWLLLAGMLALALEPLVRLAERRGLGHTAAVLVVWFGLTLLGLGVLSTLVPLLLEQVQALVRAAPELVARARRLPWLGAALTQAGLGGRSLGVALAGPALKALHAVVGAVLEGITIYFLALFMLLFGRDLGAAALSWVTPSERARWATLADHMQRAVSGYVLGTLVVSAVTGAVVAAALLVAGVPYFLALGLLAGALQVVPFVGSFVTEVLVLGLTFATQGLGRAVAVFVALTVYHNLKNHLLNPLIQRRTIDMNPLLITVVLLAGTAAAGILGSLVALPVAGAAQVLLREAQQARASRWDEEEQLPAH